MKRRTFLKGLAGSASAASLAACKSDESEQPGTTPPTKPTTTTPDTTSITEPPDVGPALEPGVPQSLQRSDEAELDVTLQILGGALPANLNHTAFVVHPIPYEDGSPVFLGDGKVLSIALSPTEATLTSRIIKPASYYADLGSVNEGFGFENNGLARMSEKLGVRNSCNTALIVSGERLFATADVGRPWELDPVTLVAKTPVGWLDEWTSIFPNWLGGFLDWPCPMHQTTAHPGIDRETGEMFNVNYAVDMVGLAYCDLLVWSGEGAMKRYELRSKGKKLEIFQSVHSMVVTKNHVVLMDTAFVVEIPIFGPVPAEEQKPYCAVHIVKRSDLVEEGPVDVITAVIAREGVHFLADWEDDNGLVLHIAQNPAADASEAVRAGDILANGQPAHAAHIGLPSGPTDLGGFGRYVIDTQTGTFVESSLFFDEAFWGGPALVAYNTRATKHTHLYWASLGLHPELRLRRMENMYGDHPYRKIALEDLPSRQNGTLARVDVVEGSIGDVFQFPPGRQGVSPLFLPADDADEEDQTNGYILLTVISDDASEGCPDQLWLFDAMDLAKGPIARLGHPELSMPFTLHTAAMASPAARTSSYMVPVSEDYAELVEGSTPAIQAVFEDVVFPAMAEVQSSVG